jgi:protein-tyrosine phosphatase
MGFKVIIAHIERYHYLSLSDMEMIKRTGALIQVNTSSILGLDKAVKAKNVLKMMKLGLVDLVSSDCHNLEVRSPNMMTCYTFLKKYIDLDVLDQIFKENPKKIVDAIS